MKNLCSVQILFLMIAGTAQASGHRPSLESLQKMFREFWKANPSVSEAKDRSARDDLNCTRTYNGATDPASTEDKMYLAFEDPWGFWPSNQAGTYDGTVQFQDHAVKIHLQSTETSDSVKIVLDIDVTYQLNDTDSAVVGFERETSWNGKVMNGWHCGAL